MKKIRLHLMFLVATIVLLVDLGINRSSLTTPVIVGSTSRTARKGYSHKETLENLANVDHRRWDLLADETMRWLHLNGSQYFNHAWVHRAGAISTLDTEMNSNIGNIKADTILGKISLDEWITNGTVDGYLVIHKGKIIYEQYPRMRSFDKHHWWSVRKGLVGTMVAMLEDLGKVNVNQPIEYYIPELNGTAWQGITVIDILDMASGTSGLEADEPEALTGDLTPYYRYEASVGNRPLPEGTPKSTYDYVAGLPSHRSPGEAYEYTTVNTFVLTWLVESVTEKPFAEAVSEMLWRKIGAESDGLMMVSSVGASSTFNSTLRDLGRFGLLFTPSWSKVTDKRLVSQAYLDKIQNGGRPEIFAQANAGKTFNTLFADDLPSHNTYQWDFVMPDGDFFKAGHNGQGLYISPNRDTVIAFFGSGDDPSIFVSVKLARAIVKSINE